MTQWNDRHKTNLKLYFYYKNYFLYYIRWYPAGFTDYYKTFGYIHKLLFDLFLMPILTNKLMEKKPAIVYVNLCSFD